MTSAEKLFAPDAEKGVLSALLQFPRETTELLIEEGVTREWFPSFPRPFEILRDLAASGVAMNYVTTSCALRDADAFNAIGGVAVLTEMFYGVCGGSHFGSFINILREKFLARSLVALAKDILALAEDDAANAGSQLVLHVANRTAELSSYTIKNTTLSPIAPLVIDAVKKLELVYKNRGHTLGIPIGIHGVDRMTNGIMASHCQYWLGRPSHGKSAIGGHIARHISTNPDPFSQAWVVIFTLEMTALQLVTRQLMTEAGIAQQRVRDGLISDGNTGGVYTESRDDWKKIYDAAQKIGASRQLIDTSSNLTIGEIEPRIRRFVRALRAKNDAALRAKLTEEGKDVEQGLKDADAARLMSDRPDVVIILDQLQNLRPTDPKLPRYLQIKNDCHVLAALAKDLHIGMVILGQLKDAEHEGPDKLPAISDARESGDIEAYAHEIIMVHRPAMYLLDPVKAEAWCEKHTEDGGFEWRAGSSGASGLGQRDLAHLMKLVIGKNREGPVGVVDCHFEPSLTRLSNWNPDERLFSTNPKHQQAYVPGASQP